jgi:hypothetical protein
MVQEQTVLATVCKPSYSVVFDSFLVRVRLGFTAWKRGNRLTSYRTDTEAVEQGVCHSIWWYSGAGDCEMRQHDNESRIVGLQGPCQSMHAARE